MNNDELRKKFGVTGEQLDAWANEYEGVDWSHMRFGDIVDVKLTKAAPETVTPDLSGQGPRRATQSVSHSL